MFHALPPSAETELRARLAKIANSSLPKASVEGLMDLDGGVAFRVVTADLDRIREELAADLHGLLGAQDSGGWRPHVTVQNKVAPKQSRALIRALEEGFVPRPLAISGLGLYRYLGGPWECITTYAFRG